MLEELTFRDQRASCQQEFAFYQLTFIMMNRITVYFMNTFEKERKKLGFASWRTKVINMYRKKA